MDFLSTLQQWNITPTREALAAFERYYALLVEWNAKFNLTAITDKADVYDKHFADSLAGLPYMQGHVCDVGAGAGFPSLPCAIVRGGAFTLLDSVNKKVTFLQEAAEVLSLTDVQAIHCRAEEAGQGALREQFDTVTARAVAPLPTLLEYLAPLAKTNGHVVVYKTDAVAEQALAEHAAKVLHLTLTEVHKYAVGDAKRAILVYTKTAPTPRQYPRSGNKPRIRPL